MQVLTVLELQLGSSEFARYYLASRAIRELSACKPISPPSISLVINASLKLSNMAEGPAVRFREARAPEHSQPGRRAWWTWRLSRWHAGSACGQGSGGSFSELNLPACVGCALCRDMTSWTRRVELEAVTAKLKTRTKKTSSAGRAISLEIGLGLSKQQDQEAAPRCGSREGEEGRDPLAPRCLTDLAKKS